MDVCDFGHTFPFIKQLTFYRKEAFEVKAFLKRENLDVLIGNVGEIWYIRILNRCLYV